MDSDFALVIPTLNARRHFEMLLPRIAKQTAKPSRFIVLDSDSTDGTRELAESAGAVVVPIARSKFNHGGTRTQGLRLAEEHGITVFMTQDAIPVDEFAFETLLAPFQDQNLIVAYGRQTARRQAGPIEAFARRFNYPPTSQQRSAADIPKIGFKVCFCSNSFAAYRTGVLLNAGGFRNDVIFGEDTIAVAELILEGATVQYVADAMVEHSHHYSIPEEFRRYFDIGVLHSRESELLKKFGSVGGAGRSYVTQELCYLLRAAPWLIPEAIARTLSKFAAYKLGFLENRLPLAAKRRLSMNRRYWG
ncbi:glycosyltransferase [Bradyrhizobium sp. SSUT112]|uniref:glycosyltransferase family 2 protein n=1 Tax=Bradyrhizobium sp. SSUT112 TaxID=3040604 RepID=UPI00244C9539|nr:glycosyltransferase [Bradyrhizobium sp. SSUT112]MDH2357123.1 glycosyltransferase [Bradyrhizobium sp. SSUT112]